jgi:hypothetical protein
MRKILRRTIAIYDDNFLGHFLDTGTFPKGSKKYHRPTGKIPYVNKKKRRIKTCANAQKVGVKHRLRLGSI